MCVVMYIVEYVLVVLFVCDCGVVVSLCIIDLDVDLFIYLFIYVCSYACMY